MHTLFNELALIFSVACVLALIISKLRQPSIVAYIVAGIILGPVGLGLLRQGDILEELSTLGVALLLFLVGLELNTNEIKRYGKNAITAGILQVIFTTAIGYGIATLLGFSWSEATYVALALTFSSTILVIKLLTEKKELQSLSGRLVVGIFLTQDLIALLLLIVLSGVSGDTSSWQSLVFSALKGVGFAFGTWWLGKAALEKLLHKFGKSDEIILIMTLGWGLGLAALAASPVFGFSLEIGGFLAGISLAKSSVQHQIGAKVKSLRDFFLVLFFISLGSQLSWATLGNSLGPAIWLSLFVLIGNPLIVLLILGKMGFSSRTAFLAGITVGQVSEFSLILGSLGLRLGHISQETFGLLAIISIGTMIISSYCITHAESIYSKLKVGMNDLPIFRNNIDHRHTVEKYSGHVVIVGAHQMGTRLAEILHKKHAKFIVVDFDPEVVEKLKNDGMQAVCGDAADISTQEAVGMSKAKIVISTLPQLQDNLGMLEIVKAFPKKPKVIISCHLDSDAQELYKNGADYCLLPHQLSSMHLGHILSSDSPSTKLKQLHKMHAAV